MALRFDETQELTALTRALKDVLDAEGAFHGLTQIVIQGTSFPDLTPEQAKAAPNAALDVAELKKDLDAAQAHAVTWVNEIAPEITILAQAFINVGTFVSTWQLDATRLSHEQIIQVLEATAEKIGHQADTLSDLSTKVGTLQQKVSADADNFSGKHAAFAELEKLDEVSLTATAAAIKKIKALIKQESDTINADLLHADQKLELATAVMNAGKEGDDWSKIATVIIGVVLIIIANKDIKEALATIQKRLQDAEKEAQYQINFTELTVQLVALQNANSALASLNSDLVDVQNVFSDAAQWFQDRQDDLTAIISAGTPNTEVNAASLEAYARAWQTLQTAGLNWQYMEVAKSIATPISLAHFDPKT